MGRDPLRIRQEKAEKYIRDRWVAPYSWWMVKQFHLDDSEEEPETYIYSSRGRLLKRPPWKWALYQFQQAVKRGEIKE